MYNIYIAILLNVFFRSTSQRFAKEQEDGRRFWITGYARDRKQMLNPPKSSPSQEWFPSHSRGRR